jgi:acetylglutamate kinase
VSRIVIKLGGRSPPPLRPRPVAAGAGYDVVVVHGAGPQITPRWSAGNRPDFVEGGG